MENVQVICGSLLSPRRLLGAIGSRWTARACWTSEIPPFNEEWVGGKSAVKNLSDMFRGISRQRI